MRKGAETTAVSAPFLVPSAEEPRPHTGQRSQRSFLPAFPTPRGITHPADGMARLSTRHEPMWAVGNGRETEARQGAIRIF
jgi:hypothetical protein